MGANIHGRCETQKHYRYGAETKMPCSALCDSEHYYLLCWRSDGDSGHWADFVWDEIALTDNVTNVDCNLVPVLTLTTAKKSNARTNHLVRMINWLRFSLGRLEAPRWIVSGMQRWAAGGANTMQALSKSPKFSAGSVRRTAGTSSNLRPGALPCPSRAFSVEVWSFAGC